MQEFEAIEVEASLCISLYSCVQVEVLVAFFFLLLGAYDLKMLALESRWCSFHWVYKMDLL